MLNNNLLLSWPVISEAYLEYRFGGVSVIKGFIESPSDVYYYQDGHQHNIPFSLTGIIPAVCSFTPRPR